MKLHLPKLLRNSVLACIAAVAGVVSSTVGSATFAGGFVAFALSGQAQAATYTDPTVRFSNGDVLELGDGATVSESILFVGDSTDASITLNVTDGTVTWATTQAENKGVSTVNIATGATLDVTTDEGRYCVFASKEGADVTINLETGAKLLSKNLFGWENQSRGEALRTVNMAAGSEWTIQSPESFYLNNTVINLSGAKMVLANEGTAVCFERRTNSINTTADATRMSEISGAGSIKAGNNGNGGGEEGYIFNVVRGSFDIDATNTADLRVSALLANGDGARRVQKLGDGIMEMTAANPFSHSFHVRAGELKFTGEGNMNCADLSVQSGGTLTLNTSVAFSSVINLQDGGILNLASGQSLGANANLGGTVKLVDTVTLTAGTLAVREDTTVFDLSGWAAGEADTYQLFTVDGGTLAAGKVQVAGYEGSGTWVLDGTGMLSLQSLVTWSGGASLTWADGTTFDDGATFTNNAMVNFAADQGDVTATVEGAVSAIELTVESGTKLILAGTGTVNATETVVNGDLTVQTAGNTLGTIALGGDSKLTIAVEGETSLADSVGTTNISGGTIYIADGTTLTESTSGLISRDMVVQGTLKFAGGDVINYNATNKFTITVDGGSLDLGEHRQSLPSECTLVLKDATVFGTGDAYGALDFFENGGTIVSYGESSIDAPVRLRPGGQTTYVNVVDGTLTSLGNLGNNNNGNVTKVGAGTFAIGGTVTTSGTVFVNEGVLKMLDGSSVSSVLSLAGGTLSAEGTTATIATLAGRGDVVLGADVVLTVNNATGLINKKGEGNLVINNLSGSQLNMNYDGPLTINNMNLSENAVLTYGIMEGSLLQIDSLSTNVVINVLELQDKLAEGIDLGLASSISADKISVLGLDAGEYTLQESNGNWKLFSEVAFHSDWDMNWGTDVIISSPMSPVEIAVSESGDFSLAGTDANDQSGRIAAVLTGGGSGVSVFGGSALPNGTSNTAFQGDTWIRAEEGQYKLITGGHFANSWGSGTIGHFTGDSHIVVDGATVGSIVGGSHQDGRGPIFTGNSYISIFSGDVTAAIVGAGTNAHGNTTHFNGTTNIYIYVPLSTVNTNGMGGAAPADAVIGAGTSFDPQSRGCTNNLTGATNVTVDLSGYTGDAAEFKKKVFGGHYNWSGTYQANITGDTNVNIIGNSDVTFTADIVGGSRNNGGTINTTGTSSVNISGSSTYSSKVVAGSYLAGNFTSTTGGTKLSISGGTFNGGVYGGAYHENAGTSTTGDVVISLAGGTFAGNVVAGSHLETQSGSLAVGDTSVSVSGGTVNGDLIGGLYINGTGDAAVTGSMGDSTITISGGKVTNVYGGSYTVRNTADSTISQGDIVIDLQGGEIAGNVYAAGYQGNATGLTTGSTTVKVSSAATIAAGKTISGGYKTSQTNSVITGDSTLVFTDTQDRSGVTFTDFNKVEVADKATATIGALTSIDKVGAGVLATVAGVSGTGTGVTVNVNEGTLLLSGTASMAAGTVNVAQGAALEISTTEELNAGTGSIAGAGSLVKSETGTATVDTLGADWTGDITVNGGTLNLSAMGGTASVAVNTGAALNVTDEVACEVSNSGTLTADTISGAVTNSGTLTAESISGAVTNSGALAAGDISGKLTSTGGSLEITGASLSSTDISISGTTLKGTWSAAGAALGAGVVVDTTGTVTLEGADLGSQITVNAGTLALTGDTTLSGFEAEVNITFADSSNNGFDYTSDVYAGVIALGEGGAVDTTDLKVDGYDVTMKDDGSLVADHGVSTIYWVSTGTVTYNDELNIINEKDESATGFKLNGGELVIGKDLDTIKIEVAANGGTLNIAAGQTLESSDFVENNAGTAQLTGEGVYGIGSELELAGPVQLAAGWKGIVSTAATEISEDTTLALGQKVEFTSDTLTLGGALNAEGAGLILGENLIFDSYESVLSADSLSVRGGELLVSLSTAALADVTATTTTLLTLKETSDSQVFYGEDRKSIIADGTTIEKGTGRDGLYDAKLCWNGNKLDLITTLREGLVVWEDAPEGSDQNTVLDSESVAPDSDVAFIGGGSSVVEVSGAASVQNVIVSNHTEAESMEYTFTGDSINIAENLTVNYGAGLTVENEVTVKGDTVVGNDSESALTVNGGTLIVEGDTKVNGELAVMAGTLSTTNVAAAEAQVTLGSGATLAATESVEAGSIVVDASTLTAQDIVVAGSLDMAENATITATGDVEAGSIAVAGASTLTADKAVVAVTIDVATDSSLAAETATVKTVENAGKLNIAGMLTATSPAATYSLRSTAADKGIITNSGEMTVGGVVADEFTMTGGTLEITSNEGFQSAETTIAAGTLIANSVDWSIDGGTLGAVTIEGDKTVTLNNVKLTETLVNNGNLELTGTIDISELACRPESVFTGLDGQASTNGNGYASTTNTYTIVTGNAPIVDLTNIKWDSGLTVDGYEYSNGLLTEKVSFSYDEYVVNADLTYDAALNKELVKLGTTKLQANGGTLNVKTALKDQKLTVGGATVNVNAAVTQEINLISGLVNINAAVAGINAKGGTINIGTGATDEVKVKGSKVTITGGNGVAGLTIDKGVVANLALADTTVTTAKEGVTLNGTLSNGVLSVTRGATLAGNLTMDHSTLSIASTENDLKLTAREVASLSQTGLVSIGSFTVDADDIEVTGEGVEVYDKYFTGWKVKNGKVVAAGRNTSFYTAKAGDVSANGAAGLALADAALLDEKNDWQNVKDSDLGAVLSILDTAGKTKSDELGASLAGASTAVLGMAVMGDVERQLKAIRNRTTTMGVDQSVANDDMPYFNAWINAEGDRAELGENSTASGYELNSWGGTVGFDVDFCPTVTAGLALTAMYGDLDATGADTATGSMDSYYVSVFARYAPSAWTHTFVGTIGTSDISLDRTVNGVQLEGETSGMSFGFMYEVGRVFALDEDGTACLQPVFNVAWRHTTVDGYTEDGSDLALEVGEQTLDTITFGMGARLQSVVGESMYNRTSILEARVLAKVDAGDRCGSSKVALGAVPGASSSVDSNEMGAFGLEAGAGLTIPVGQDGGSIFMDASVELRSDYTNVNGTVGYRINF